MRGKQANPTLADEPGHFESCYGSEGWGFGSLRACHYLPRSQRWPLGSRIAVLVIWPHFGLTSLVGRGVEAVGVAVHLAGVQVPVQVGSYGRRSALTISFGWCG